MKRPRKGGLACRLTDALADSPRPLLLGEIESMLDFEYDAAEIMSALVKLLRSGRVKTSLKERDGPGRRVAKAYSLAETDLGL
jgi:hypothetical protein